MKRIAFLAALAAFAANASASGIRVEPEVQAGIAAPKRAAPAAATPVAAEIRLEAPILPKAAPSSPMGAPMQVGYPRDVEALAGAQDVAARLSWTRADDGASVAAIRVVSPGASALRLGLRVEGLAPGTVLRFQGTERAPFEVAAGRIPLGGTWWAPVVEGEAATLSLVVPAGEDPARVRFAVPQVSHIFASARSGFRAKSASLCHLDVNCAPDWGAESKSVARIVFTSGGASFICSGVLLADRDGGTTIPFLLTARHCLSTASAAATVQAYWFYRSTACDSGALSPDYEVTANGATLLYASSLTDTTLLRLDDTPPEGAIYAGWIVGAGALEEGTGVTAIHHPAGDEQRLSVGDVRGFFNCLPSALDPTSLTCDATMPEHSTFYGIAWTGGTIEGGSSGGGVFLDEGHYLLGQIYGGNGSCIDPAWTFAGRFDVAYEAGLSRWLGLPNATGTTTHAAEAAPLYEVTDLWWNAAESGWGISLTQHGSTVFGAWFAYDEHGNARWVVMPGGTWTDEQTYTGDLYATTGPDGLGATFDPSKVTRTRVGQATLAFDSGGQAMLTYAIDGVSGSKAIVRQPFGPENSVSPGVFGDLWWNAQESGWGLSISQQHGTLFAVWYTYGADGKPAWYVLPGGTWISGDTYTGTIYRTRDAASPFFGGAFDPASVTRTPVGTMTLTFASADHGTMAYTVDGASGAKAITRQPF